MTTNPAAKMKTRIITSNVVGRWTWRAPIRMKRGIAIVELKPINKWYADEPTARKSGERHVKSLMPQVVFE